MVDLAAYPLMVPFSLPFVKGSWASVFTSKFSVSLVGDLRWRRLEVMEERRCWELGGGGFVEAGKAWTA